MTNGQLNIDQSYVFPYIKKGSNYLIKEFPDEKKYQDSKEKIEELIIQNLKEECGVFGVSNS